MKKNEQFDFRSNRILVLSQGCLQEFDEPQRLAANPQSAFAKLLRDANIQLSTIASNSGQTNETTQT